MPSYYMESKIKSNFSVKKEYLQELYETYPNAFEKKEKIIKIKQQITFTKLITMKTENKILIIEKLWVVYYGYFALLIDTMNYDNRIEFKDLKKLWIKDWMIKLFRKKWTEFWLFRKHDWDYYVNPLFAIKWETINPNLIKLFE